jgi:AraC family ethanolamine operon transcriptional activator
LVAAAEEHLRAHPSRLIYVDELCSVLGVAPRTLYGSFVATLHMSPSRYLKRRRLIMVHQGLQSACHYRLLVKTVALDHDFWHLGRFARDYCALFGETPSETAAYARWSVNIARESLDCGRSYPHTIVR